VKVGDLVSAPYYGFGIVTKVDDPIRQNMAFICFADSQHWAPLHLVEVINESR
jgi:hypothetical protein